MSGYSDVYSDTYSADDPFSSLSLTYTPGIVSPVVMPIDDFYGLISSAEDSTWQTTTTVSSQVSVSFNVTQQQVTSTVASKWNTIFRVKANNEAAGFSQGILQPVVHPIDWYYTPAGSTWEVDQRRASLQSTNWKVISRKSSQKTVFWNTNIVVHTERAANWRVLQRVYVPGYSSENVYLGILQPVVHPIDQQPNIIVPPIAWNYLFRNSTKILSRFNTNGSVVSGKAIAWNTNDTHVVVQGASTWFTRQIVKPGAIIAWNTRARRSAGLWSGSAWNVDLAVVKQGATTWNFRTRVPVIRTVTTEYSLPMPVVHPISVYQSVVPEFQWGIEGRIAVKAKSTWNIDALVKVLGKTSWNTLLRMSVPNFSQIYYPQILQPATHPITAKTYPWIPRITWNFSNRITGSQQTSNWKTLNIVVKSAPLRWNTVGRTNTQGPVGFMTRISVVAQVAVKWNTGQITQEFIRQTAMNREDFAY